MGTQYVGNTTEKRLGLGTLYAATANNALWCRSAVPQWQKLDDNPTTVAIACVGNARGDVNIYQLRTDGSVLRGFDPTWKNAWREVKKDPGIRKITGASFPPLQSDPAEPVYSLHQDGRIARAVASPSPPFIGGWEELDDNPETADITANHKHLFQLHKNGRIWKYVGPPHTGWQELDNNPATQKIVYSNALYQLHDNGRIFKYVGPPFTGWQELDNNPATIDIVADGFGSALYQLHDNGRIFKYVGPPLTGWQEILNHRSTRQIAVANDRLYQIDNTGIIWKWLGPFWQQLDDNHASSAIVAESPSWFTGTAEYVLYKIDNTGAIWRYEDRAGAGFALNFY